MKIRWGTIFHDAFEVGVTLKFLHGLIELFGGLFLLFKAKMIGNWLFYLISFELKEDPNDWIGNYFANLANYLTVEQHLFPVIYLIIHSAINLFLATSLWLKKLWAYPLTMILLGLFSTYQIYRFFLFHSITLLIFTAIDIFVMVLTWLEYKRLLLAQNQQNL